MTTQDTGDLVSPVYSGDGGVLRGLVISSSTYSLGAVAIIVRSWRRFEAENMRMRGALHVIATCERSALCPECAALAREDTGGHATDGARYEALGRAVVAYERLKPRADGGAIEIPTAERAAQVVAARAEVQERLREVMEGA